jgi:hypothetical protein
MTLKSEASGGTKKSAGDQIAPWEKNFFSTCAISSECRIDKFLLFWIIRDPKKTKQARDLLTNLKFKEFSLFWVN